MEIEVKNCRDCIMRKVSLQMQESFCGIDKEERLVEDDLGESFKKSPKWCPLRKEPVTIKLKTN